MTDGWRVTPRGTYICMVPQCPMATEGHEYERCCVFRRHWRHTHEQPKRQFLCARKECSEGFPSVRACRAHMKQQHNWAGPQRLATKMGEGPERFVDPLGMKCPPANHIADIERPTTSSPSQLGDVTLALNLNLNETMIVEQHLKRERAEFDEAYEEQLRCEGDPDTWTPPRKVLLLEGETNGEPVKKPAQEEQPVEKEKPLEQVKEKQKAVAKKGKDDEEARLKRRLEEVQKAKQQLEQEERSLWAQLLELARQERVGKAAQWKEKYDGLLAAVQTISREK